MAIKKKKAAKPKPRGGKSGKPRKKTPRVPPHKGAVYPNAKPNPYSGPGRKALYETVEELEEQIDGYFKYIEGEFHIEKRTGKRLNEDTGKNEVYTFDEKVWDRYPEYPRRTALVLYLGYASHTTLLKQAEVSEEFRTVLARATSQVEDGYEKHLRDRDMNPGSRFALSNMGWAAKQAIQNLGANGQPVDPAPGVVISVTQLAPNAGKL